MNQIHRHAESFQSTETLPPTGDLDSFLTGLTELSLQYGVGIADAPTLYVLERDDREYAYSADSDGRLVLR